MVQIPTRRNKSEQGIFNKCISWKIWNNADRLLAYDEADERKQHKEEDVTDYINDVIELARRNQMPD